MQKVGQAALQDKLTWELLIVVHQLMQDEWENLDEWKEKFLENQKVLRRKRWRCMPLEWIIGTIDNQGGEKMSIVWKKYHIR